MTGAHLHLLLTHVPVLGIIFGLLVTGYGFLRRKTDALQIGLGTFVFSGIAAAAVYLTGESAEEVVEDMGGVSHAIIERHEEAAIVALIAALALGAISLVGLWLSRKDLPRWFAGATLIAALAVTGVMAWTANLGGQINHPEIRANGSIAASGEIDGSEASYQEEDEDDD